MPEQVHECVESVLDDNPDMEESKAYAICQAEMQAKVDKIETATLDELLGESYDLDAFVEQTEGWEKRQDGIWVNEEEAYLVYDVDVMQDLPEECRKCGENDRMEGSMVCSDCFDDGAEQQAEDGHVLGPATNSVSYRLEEGEVYCESEGEVFEQSDADDGTCPHCGEPIQGTDAQAETPPKRLVVEGDHVSEEMAEGIRRRCNADVTVVDGEASAAPTDSQSSEQ